MLDFEKCPCSGSNLDKLIQPLILINLTKEDLYGYKIVQLIADSPMFEGTKPDGSGVYRSLKAMEQRGLVKSSWSLVETGPSKRIYHITNTGIECLSHWCVTLKKYHQAIGLVLEEALNVFAKTNVSKDNL